MKSPYAVPAFISLSLIPGMVIGLETSFPLGFTVSLTAVCLVVTILLFFRANRMIWPDKSFVISAFLTFIVLGMLVTKLRNPLQSPAHYRNFDGAHPTTVVLQIKKTLKPNAYYRSYIAGVQRIGGKGATGNVFLSLHRDSTSNAFHIDDRIAVYGRLDDLPPPLNPHQFDYGAYLADQHIAKQIRVSSDHVLALPRQRSSLRGIAAGFRRNIDHTLRSSTFSTRQRGLIEALLLGQKQELSQSTYTAFTKAGVVHILAVSGLHVGILLFFFSQLLRPLTLLRGGGVIRTVLVIVLLWGYAFLVGLSPSILRAVTMFSFLSLGLFFQRRVFSINMLCLSAIILLLYDPYFLKSVGFQLSYSAVLAILLFQPKLYGLFTFKKRVWRYLWSLISVTLAAQLGVMPLSLFYFHQFPGLFLLSNLLILPFLGVLIGLGVVVLVFAACGRLPQILTRSYGTLLDLLYNGVTRISDQEQVVFEHIHFSWAMLLFSYIAIAAIALLIYQRKKRYVFIGITALIVTTTFYLIDYQRDSHARHFYIFHKSRHSVFGKFNHHHLQVMTDKSFDNTPLDSLAFLDDFKDQKIVDTRARYPIENYYRLGSHRLLVVDSLGIWRLPQHIEITDVVLIHSPKINLDRLIDRLNPKRIIADGSNYTSFVKRWRQTCTQYEVTFHYTGNQGAFDLSY